MHDHGIPCSTSVIRNSKLSVCLQFSYEVGWKESTGSSILSIQQSYLGAEVDHMIKS
jgi:hypothetical protein